MKPVTVITASVGSRHLRQCIESVQTQDYPNVRHLIVYDGTAAPALDVAGFSRHPLHFVHLPYQTGAGGMNGYRIYSAFCGLVEQGYVTFLDDDNWIDPWHLSSLVGTIEKFSTDWGFALRWICRQTGEKLVEDDCDSLGCWRRAASYQGPSDHLPEGFQRFYAINPFLVDTSCYCFKSDLIASCAHHLLDAYWGDSLLASALVRENPVATSGRRTVYYRLRSDAESGAYDYFIRGNAEQKRRFSEFPWLNPGRHEPLVPVRRPS